MDSKSTFIRRFGDLVALLRVDPGNDAAQELALSAAVAAVAHDPLHVEIGIEGEFTPDGISLRSRMLARQVDSFSIATGAPPQELESFARALAHDVTPVPSSPHIEVEFVRLLARPPHPPDGGGGPGNRRHGVERRRHEERRRSTRTRWAENDRRHGLDRRVLGERRLHLVKDHHQEITRLLAVCEGSCRSLAWEEALHHLHTLVRLVPRVPLPERSAFEKQVRQAFPRSAIGGLVHLAELEYAVRDRAAEVLRWIGLDAVELILERLAQGEALGVRVFFYDVVAGVPAAYRLVVPMLGSSAGHVVRHGATLLGRLGAPEALEPLLTLLNHPDELVRSASLHALGELHGANVAGPLREALRHPSSRTRVAAAEAIALWQGGELAGLLGPALEEERDRDAWQAMVTALGQIGTPDACDALATVALTRRSILRRRGYTTGQRLAAVAALGLADTAAGHETLRRLARESEGVISYAAERLLQAEAVRAG